LTEESLSRKGFIKLGAAWGVSTCGASILAGCGGGGSEAPGKEAVEGGLTGGVEGAAQSIGGGTKEGGTTVAEIGVEEAIARVEDVPPGTAVEFTDAELEQPALLVHLENGGFVAYSAVCTHRQCIVNYRRPSRGTGRRVCRPNPGAGAAAEAGPRGQTLARYR
jgi:Rieske Fe-S protein